MSDPKHDAARYAFIQGYYKARPDASVADTEQAFQQWWASGAPMFINWPTSSPTKVYTSPEQLEADGFSTRGAEYEEEAQGLFSGLSNGPAPQWRCAGRSCPERAPVSAPTSPRCYTCDRPMSRYEQEITLEKVLDANAKLKAVLASFASSLALPPEIVRAADNLREFKDRSMVRYASSALLLTRIGDIMSAHLEDLPTGEVLVRMTLRPNVHPSVIQDRVVELLNTEGPAGVIWRLEFHHSTT